MRKHLIHCGLFAATLIGLSFGGTANADAKGEPSLGNNECPVGLVNGMELDDEFGEGTQELTRCIAKRNQVKLLVQINQYCARSGGTYGEGENENYPKGTPKCSRAYALQNIENVIADYETTYGMTVGKDYEIAAVVHSGGGPLVIQDWTNEKIVNEFEGQVQKLMNLGVRFYFCQNTTRSYQASGLLPADATGALVTSVDDDGVPHSVEYVTAGITALADFQRAGWTYVQP